MTAATCDLHLTDRIGRGIDWARIAMPGPVVEFVEGFDDGAYPDLVIGGELR